MRRPVSNFAAHRLLGAVAGLALSAASSQAQEPAAQGASPTAAVIDPARALGANLNISPKRIRFDRAQRSATVYIFNQGTAPASFDIGLVDRVMLPDGRISPLEEVASSPELKPITERVHSAKPMLVTAPRRVTLAPGKGQTIRIRATPAETGGVAEYRSHLTVTTIPSRDIGLTAEEAAAGSPEELRFSISSVFGLSIPLIIRTGEADVSAKIENLKLTTIQRSPDGVAPPRAVQVLELDLVRAGTHSLFGNLEVRGLRVKEPIGAARGVGVYTEIDRRTVQIPLNRAPLKGEALEIRFTDDDAAPGRLLATKSLAAP